MLRQRSLSDFRSAARPLAWLLVGAVATSTSTVYAQSADGPDFGDSLDSGSESEGDPSAPPWLEAPWAALIGGVPSSAATTSALASAAAAPGQAAHSSSAASSTAPAPAQRDDGAGLRTAGYIAGGVGLAGFILFAVAGIGAKNAHDRLDEACAAGRCNEASRDADIEDGKMLQTAANIGLATGLTGLGLGATLVVLGSHSTSDAPSVARSAPGGMVTFAGHF